MKLSQLLGVQHNRLEDQAHVTLLVIHVLQPGGTANLLTFMGSGVGVRNLDIQYEILLPAVE
jgi:hypothetical protein